MGIRDIYSKRRKREAGEFPDVYQYNDIPRALRVQIVHIWNSAFESAIRGRVEALFQEIHQMLCREYGVFYLGNQRDDYFDRIVNFMLESKDTDRVLDVVEITFQVMDEYVRDHEDEFYDSQSPDEAIAELNARLREHGVGFQYEAGKILRVDSQLIHAEVVKPALMFLSGSDYKGANHEFLSAHNHYRDRKFKECLNDCLKAFESTMKSICAKRGWTHEPGATANALLKILFEEALIPPFMQSHFTGLRATLEAGVPTIRNKLGGHGQGPTPIQVPDFVASYALHLTATNILFLVQAEKELK